MPKAPLLASGRARQVRTPQTVYNTKGTRAHTHRELIQGGVGVSERARVRRRYDPLCSTFVAAKGGSICIAVVGGKTLT